MSSYVGGVSANIKKWKYKNQDHRGKLPACVTAALVMDARGCVCVCACVRITAVCATCEVKGRLTCDTCSSLVPHGCVWCDRDGWRDGVS